MRSRRSHNGSRCRRAQGRLEAARETLRQARGEAEAKGARAQLWKILLSLSEVEALLGGDAGALRAQAHAIVADIAARLDGTELRESILELAGGQGVVG